MDEQTLRRAWGTVCKDVEKAELILNNPQYTQAIIDFLSKFVVCEIACKAILAGAGMKNDKLNMKSIKSAVKKLNYGIEYAVLRSIFGSYKIRGSKSAKKLRDGIAHSLAENDIKEVIERKEDLFKYMDTFLDVVKKKQTSENELPVT